jgi:hypothetical protein
MPLLLPHEWIFGGYMLITWLRLLRAEGFLGGDSLMFLGSLLTAAALAVWGQGRDTAAAWRLRLLFYPLAMNILFQQMRSAIPAMQPARFDGQLLVLDRLVLPDTPSFLLDPLVTPIATDIFSFFYLLFFPYLLFSLIYYFAGETRVLKAFVAGLFSLYGIGFLGYTLVPAAGPYLAFAREFHTPLTGGVLTQWNAALVKVGSSGVDVFPSLHVAVSGFLLGFDYRHKRWRFLAYTIPCLSLWLSTQYLRYHYLIDVLMGMLLALFALWIAERQYAIERRLK